MTTAQQAYAPPGAELEHGDRPAAQGWRLLALWTACVTLLNLCLSVFTCLVQGSFSSIDVLLAFVFGNVFVIPLLILALSQLFRKHRNARARVKAFLYPGYFVLLSQLGTLFSLLGDVSAGGAV